MYVQALKQEQINKSIYVYGVIPIQLLKKYMYIKTLDQVACLTRVISSHVNISPVQTVQYAIQ